MTGAAAWGRAAAWAVAVALAPTSASAAEPRLPAEPPVMRESGEGTVVPDAFDEDDPIDVHLSLAYAIEVAQGTVARGRDGQERPVAVASRVGSRLEPKAEIGLYENLALVVRLGILLSESSEVAPVGAASGGTIGAGLVTLPTRSADRSGLEHVGVGVVWGPLDQSRDPDVPTWTLGVDARISPGVPMTACRQDPPEGQLACAHPADRDRDGVRDPGDDDARDDLDGGVARGTVVLAATTTLARRIRYVMPYTTLRGEVEIPIRDAWSEPSLGRGEVAPPLRGEAYLGAVVVPWENRERFARVSIDARAEGGVVSRGRDYGELFDAVGSSDAPSLRAPSERDGRRAWVSGLGVVDAHALVGAWSAVVWQASSLIKLGVGVGARYRFAHAVLDERRCDDGSDDCDVPTNPAFREELAGDGRLTVRDAFVVRVAAGGAVMF